VVQGLIAGRKAAAEVFEAGRSGRSELAAQ
jgi:hypothetical protein